MGRHAQGEPIPLAPGQPPYGAEGPPARLQAGYLRRNDSTRTPEDLGPRVRTVQDLTGWEKAVVAVPWLAISLLLLLVAPRLGIGEGWVRWGIWGVGHGPAYWLADRYVVSHEPWRGPAWVLRRNRVAPPD